MIVMYSTTWCSDCKATKLALNNLGLPFKEINIDDDPQGEQKVLQANAGKRSVPTLIYGDNAASMSRFNIVKLKGWLGEVGLLEAN